VGTQTSVSLLLNSRCSTRCLSTIDPSDRFGGHHLPQTSQWREPWPRSMWLGNISEPPAGGASPDSANMWTRTEDRPVPVRGGKSAVENSGVSPFTSDAEAAVVLGQPGGFDVSKKREAGQPPSAFSYPSSSDIWGARPEYGIFLQVGKLQFSKESIPEVDRGLGSPRAI
jgi:hypothetical protein